MKPRVRKTKNQIKMEARLFLPDHTQRHEHVIKEKIRKFMLGYKLLDQFLSMGTNPDDEISLQFYSNVYVDMTPLIIQVTYFVVRNGYAGKRRRVDNAIILSQNILGLLKVLHLRYVIYMTRHNPIKTPQWYQISKKSNKEIVDELAVLFEKMYSFKMEDGGGVFTYPFS